MMIGSLGVGIVAGRRIGLFNRESPVLTVFGLGLGLGLLVITLAYATLRSLGGSTYLPSAVLLAATLVLGRSPLMPGAPRRGLVALTVVASGCLFVGAAAYGMTLAPSPRDGLQPIEFMDPAFYAVLGWTLVDTGVESTVAHTGMSQLAGQASQASYHWGEIWLAALALNFPGVTPMSARHVVALPLVILATTALVAGLAAQGVRRAERREAAVLAAVGMAGVAPIPFWLDLHFDWWARPIGFSATLYGLAYVVAGLGLMLALRGRHTWTLATSMLASALTAALVASHVLVAAVAAVGVAVGWLAWLVVTNAPPGPALRSVRMPVVACLVGGVATVAWGFLTGHGLGAESPVPGVAPFDWAWRRAMLLTTVGGGVLIVGVVLAVRERRSNPRLAAIAIGSTAAVGLGALLWGWRLAEFNMFHIYYGAIAVLLTPVAVLATAVTLVHARRDGSGRVRAVLATLVFAQISIGLGATVQRLYEFGPGHYDPVPVAVLDEIKSLPEGARLAYSCDEIEEVAPWDARLISLTAHTGRPVVAMCFQVDVFGAQLGVLPPDLTRMNPFFASAPQRDLYPRSGAKPTTAEILAFLERYDIDFIYEDADHPNRLLPDARPRFSIGAVTIYEVP